jgi:predicted small secreted protein
MMKTALICAAALAAGVMFSGCETTRGFGEDVQNTGTNIQRGLSNVDPKEAQQDQGRWANESSKMDAQSHPEWANQSGVDNKSQAY